MNFTKATESYEAWLADCLDIVPRDLAYKHRIMAESFFVFFRGTFYRWAQWWPKLCEEAAAAPMVTAVTDLHIENFGTWRDREGRLVWGINDFDEAFPAAYTIDLVRLMASVHIACPKSSLAIGHDGAAKLLLESYAKGLRAGGCPFVLAEEQTPLREIARHRLRDPERFWARLERQQPVKSPPRPARKTLLDALPKNAKNIRFAKRLAGVGSLGHERFIAIADLQGGRVAREVKRRSPSAFVWAGENGKKDYYARLMEKSVRCGDPCLNLTKAWVVRRLSPDCCRVELSDLPKTWDETTLLRAMGWEMANIHLASGNPGKILKHLKKFDAAALNEAALTMVSALQSDWKRWRGSVK